MALGPWQLVIILIIVLVLFGGRGKISALMGDFGKGLKSFKSGMKEDEPAENADNADNADPKVLNAEAAEPVEATVVENDAATDKDKAANG